MSRPQLSPEQKQKVFSDFIDAAWSIIQCKGVEGLTLRKVAAAAGYNSATLYQHFRDLDELTAYAALRFLRDYGLALGDAVRGIDDPLQILYTVWEHFCHMAFRCPKALSILFFGRYSADLDQMTVRYYEAFPQDWISLEGEPVVARLFQHGSLEARSMSLMRPLVEAGLLDSEQVSRQNEILLYCFKELLTQKCEYGDDLDSERLMRRQLEYVRIVLGRSWSHALSQSASGAYPRRDASVAGARSHAG